MAQGEGGTCTHKLLMEYHDIFSLDDNELGCASQVKHNIKVTNNEPFKEQILMHPATIAGRGQDTCERYAAGRGH